MKIRLLPLIVSLMMLHPFCASAQSVDEMLQIARKERERLHLMTEEYKDEVRRMWLDHISRPWTPVDAEAPDKRVLEDRPDVPMIPLESYDYNVGEILEIPSSVLAVDVDMYRDDYFSEFPVFEDVIDGGQQVTVPLNGFELMIRYPENGKVYMADSSEPAVAEALAQMTEIPFVNTFRDLSRAREVLSLSDWSFVRLVDRLSRVVCGATSEFETVVLQAYILNAFGFHVCLGRSDDGSLHKLMTADACLYDYGFFLYGGQRFYVMEDHYVEKQKMSIIDLPSDLNRPMHMRMNPNEKFHVDASKKRKFAPTRYPSLLMEVCTDLSRMDSYAGYPMFYTESGPLSTYFHYAMVPLSGDVKDHVYPCLKKAVAGRSELEAVNILLNVVQTAFPYARDAEAWGVERYFYADELWHYGEGDCEDKSILFSHLVRDLLNLPVALVYWKGHLSCAVLFSEDVKGAYFSVGGQKYVSCDPTYENAYAGAIMDDYKTQRAELILLP